MARVRMQVARRKRRKRVLNRAEGFWGARNKLFKTAKETLLRADAFAFRDRRVRKREFRKLWIQRINAAVHIYDLTYNKFMSDLKKADIKLNRKMLAEMAVNDPDGFADLVTTVKNNAS